jgi:hypothetical protein
MSRVLQGMRLLWAELEPRKRLVVQTFSLAWLNAAWVCGLQAYSRFSQTRRAELVFAWGVAVSTVALYVWARRRIYPLIFQSIADARDEAARDRAPAQTPPVHVQPVVRGGFGQTGRQRREEEN